MQRSSPTVRPRRFVGLLRKNSRRSLESDCRCWCRRFAAGPCEDSALTIRAQCPLPRAPLPHTLDQGRGRDAQSLAPLALRCSHLPGLALPRTGPGRAERLRCQMRLWVVHIVCEPNQHRAKQSKAKQSMPLGRRHLRQSWRGATRAADIHSRRLPCARRAHAIVHARGREISTAVKPAAFYARLVGGPALARNDL